MELDVNELQLGRGETKLPGTIAAVEATTNQLVLVFGRLWSLFAISNETFGKAAALEVER